MNVMIALAVFFIIGIIFLAIFKERIQMWYDDVIVHETVTTTTVVDHGAGPGYEIEGNLIRLHDSNGQPYVVDPVDGERWNLNTTDDMYQDAEGKIWKIV